MIIDRSSTTIRSRDMSAAWRHVDLALCALVGVAALLGLALVNSATERAGDALMERQVMFVLVGCVAMGGAALVDYEKLVRWWRAIYAGAVLLLGLVIIPGVGSEKKGIRAWFDFGPVQIQPAELAKVAVIISVACYLGGLTSRPRLRELLVTLGLFAVPMALIMLQPDLGTDLVFLAVGMGMLTVAGFPARTLLALGLVGVVAVVGIMSSDTLDQYQKDRLLSFANPDDVSSAAVYNTRQAQIAIAAGGFGGAGYLDGQQTQSGAVPEQETDFIFTVAGEELGFAGAGLVLLVLAGIVWRVWRAAVLARDQIGRLICVGVLCMVVFHVFQNVGMTLGIMPVTGIPLPFTSYGGSATITMFVSMGLVLNVHMRRYV